jgi:hypothetical protein
MMRQVVWPQIIWFSGSSLSQLGNLAAVLFSRVVFIRTVKTTISPHGEWGKSMKGKTHVSTSGKGLFAQHLQPL